MADVVHVQFAGAVNNNDWVYGETGTDERMAQTFAPTADIVCPKVILCVSNEGSATDNLICRIETTSSGTPTGTLVDANATVTLAGTGIAAYTSQAANQYTFTFPATFNLTNGTTYAIVLSRSGARDTLKRYAWLIRTLGGYDGGQYYQRDSGTWNNGSEAGDAIFAVYERVADTTAGAFLTPNTKFWGA